MRTSFIVLRILLLLTGLVLLAKAVFLIDLYYEMEALFGKDELPKGYSSFQDLVSYSYTSSGISFDTGVKNYVSEYYLNDNIVFNEVARFLGSSILLALQILILSQAIRKEDYVRDLLPFRAKCLTVVNLGVRRIIGLITSIIFFSTILAIIIYPLVMALHLPFGNAYNDKFGISFILWPLAGIILYLFVWLIFLVTTWLFQGFSENRVNLKR